MKIKLKATIISVFAAAALACLIISGCSLFGGGQGGDTPKTTLVSPSVYRIGSIFNWNEVSGANKYIVSFGGGETAVTDTACRVKDIEKGGVLSIKAVNMTADGKIKEQSEKVEINLDEIDKSGTKYKSYELSDENIIIPEQVEMAVIVGDGNSHGADIFIETRTKPLIVELYDVHCYYFGLKNNDNADADQCVIVRSLGKDGSSFRGISGSKGATGATGGGIAWSGGVGGKGTDGGIAGKFNYVIFEGDKPITFRGGNGGDGGTGGVASSMNTKGGDGGTGGSGGTGLSAKNAYVALDAELTSIGGSGGEGGEGGYGKFLFSDDSGKKGANGANGSDFVGSKTEVTSYPVIEKKDEVTDDDKNDDVEITLTKPSVTLTGSIIGWNEVEGADEYIISFGGSEKAIKETFCRIDGIELGGTFTVKAVSKTESGTVKALSETASIKIDKIASSVEYDFTQAEEINIPAYTDFVKITGDGEYHRCSIRIESRTTPLLIELYDVVGDYFGLDYDAAVIMTEYITVRSLGNVGSVFYGSDGTDGGDGGKGTGISGAGGTGFNGTDGGAAGKFGYVVFEGNKPLTFRGGNGGNGGNGGEPNTNLNTKGGDGGNGGNGGAGLSAIKAYVALDGAELTCVGGNSGQGGNGGNGNFLGSNDSGKNGSRGTDGANFTGERIDAIYTVLNASETDEDTSSEVVGAYKFYSVTADGETYYVGDSLDDVVFDENFVVTVFKSDGTCVVTFSNGTESRSTVFTWEQGGDLIILTDENGNLTKANLDGNTLTLSADGLVFILERG